MYTLNTTFTPTDTADYTPGDGICAVGGRSRVTPESAEARHIRVAASSASQRHTPSRWTGFTTPAGTVQVLQLRRYACLQLAPLVGTGHTTTANLLLQSGLLLSRQQHCDPEVSGAGLQYKPPAAQQRFSCSVPAIQVNPAGMNQTTTTLVPYTFAQAGQITSSSPTTQTPSSRMPSSGLLTASQNANPEPRILPAIPATSPLLSTRSSPAFAREPLW